MLTQRPVRRDDLDAIVALYLAFDRAYRGFEDTDPADITNDWDTPGFDIATQTLVLDDGGAVVGYCVVESSGMSDSVVDLTRDAPGLQAQVLDWLGGRPGELLHYLPVADETTARLMVERGWIRDRVFWRMRIDVDAPVPEPVWPAGVEVRGMDRDADARAVHALIAAAFDDIQDGHPLRPYDEWQSHLLGDRFDPELYLVAVADGALVGASLGQDLGEYAYVRQLGVPRAHRGRGIALALLHETFRRAQRRGFPQCQLGVDASNPTGAVRLYERAGMRVSEEFVRWRRP